MCGFHLKPAIYPWSHPICQIMSTIFTLDKFLMHRKFTRADHGWERHVSFHSNRYYFLSMLGGCRLIVTWWGKCSGKTQLDWFNQRLVSLVKNKSVKSLKKWNSWLHEILFQISKNSVLWQQSHQYIISLTGNEFGVDSGMFISFLSSKFPIFNNRICNCTKQNKIPRIHLSKGWKICTLKIKRH